MHRLLVAIAALPLGVLLAGACGSSTGTGGADASTADGTSPSDAQADGVTVSPDGAVCVTIDPASYDHACAGDGDCTMISEGTVCTGGSACERATIAARDMPQ